MTKIIFAFPVRNRTLLTRVWFETGNPRQPLACKWIASRQIDSDRSSTSVEGAQAHRLCA